MVGLARAHQARILARMGGQVIASYGVAPGMVGAAGFSPANDGAPEAAYTGRQASEYQLLMAALVRDLSRLKSIQSVERKVALKGELLAQYAPWVEGVLEAGRETGRGVQDDVLVHALIWRLDVGDFAGALPCAEYVLAHHLRLPERFQRTPSTLIAELFADGALEALKAGRPAPFTELLRLFEFLAERDMPDEVRARLHKALGLELARQAETPEAADRHAAGARGLQHAAVAELKRALALNERVGVKADIQRLERALKGGGDVAVTPA